MSLRFCIDKIGQPLGHGEVELSVFEGSPGKFARLCKSAAGYVANRSQNRLHDGPSAMDVQLSDVFARETLWAWEPENERLIENLTRILVAQITHPGRPRLRPRGSQCIKHSSRRRPRDADNGYTSTAWCARKRENRCNLTHCVGVTPM